jgi:hypothetical protein
MKGLNKTIFLGGRTENKDQKDSPHQAWSTWG